MTTVGIFTIHQKVIELERIGVPMYLAPFGDVHFPTPLHDSERWQEFCAWGRARSADTLFLGMGDYIDLASSSNRKALERAGLYDFTRAAIEEKASEYTQDFIRTVDFLTPENTLGFLGGNHYFEFEDGTTSDTRICQAVGTRFLGVSAFIRLSFAYGTMRSTVDIWAHHGKGAARSHGGSIKKVEDMAEQAEADIYLMGHDHKMGAMKKARLQLSSGRGGEVKLRQRQIVVGRTGGFLKGYEPDQPSYIADANYPPLDLGTMVIQMTPQFKHGRFRVELKSTS